MPDPGSESQGRSSARVKERAEVGPREGQGFRQAVPGGVLLGPSAACAVEMPERGSEGRGSTSGGCGEGSGGLGALGTLVNTQWCLSLCPMNGCSGPVPPPLLGLSSGSHWSSPLPVDGATIGPYCTLK